MPSYSHLGDILLTNERRVVAAVVAATLTLAVAACTSTSTTASHNTTHPTTKPPAAPNRLSIVASGGQLHVTGEPRPGLVDITLHNSDTVALETDIQQVKPGVTVADALKALTAKDPDAAAAKLTVGTDALGTPFWVSPGLTTEATAPLTAGTYFVTDYLPLKNGEPHVLAGRKIAQFTVSGPISPAKPPATVGAITILDTVVTLRAIFLPVPSSSCFTRSPTR